MVLGLVSELFPPWLYEDENTSVVRSAGYHFILSPSKVKSSGEMRKIFSLSENARTNLIWAHEDGGRQLGQRITLAFLILGTLILALNPKRLFNRIAGGAFVGVGSICLALLCIYAFLILG
jgi:hypothetical protein